MFQWLGRLVKIAQQQWALNAFKKKYDFHCEGNFLTIDGKDVFDYRRLLAHYSLGEVRGFENFEELERIFTKICIATSLDLAQSKTYEEVIYGISRHSAEANIAALRLILRCIKEYVELARKHGLPPNLLEPPRKFW